jgi:outer membrane scaffolding protein for murein synthesis (MipA/OmpV family)
MRFFYSLALAGLLGSGSIATAHAEITGTVGVGAAVVRDYEGSKDSRVLGLPLFTLKMPTAAGDFIVDGQGLSWIPIQGGGFNAGVFATYNPGRRDDQDRDYRYLGSTYLRGMGRIKGSPEAGFLMGWNSPAFSPYIRVQHGFGGNDGNRGNQATIGAGIGIVRTPRLTVVVTPSLVWTDSKYMQTFFGVTALQSASSGFKAYQPQAGFKSGQVDVTATVKLSEHWSVMGMVSAKQLMGDAKKSPIVQSSSSLEYMSFLIWRF